MVIIVFIQDCSRIISSKPTQLHQVLPKPNTYQPWVKLSNDPDGAISHPIQLTTRYAVNFGFYGDPLANILTDLANDNPKFIQIGTRQFTPGIAFHLPRTLLNSMLNALNSYLTLRCPFTIMITTPVKNRSSNRLLPLPYSLFIIPTSNI